METNRKTKEQTNNEMKDNINIIDSFTFTSTSFLNLADHLQTSSKYMIAANVGKLESWKASEIRVFKTKHFDPFCFYSEP